MVEAAQANDLIAAALLGEEPEPPLSSPRPAAARAPIYRQARRSAPTRPRTPSPPQNRQKSTAFSRPARPRTPSPPQNRQRSTAFSRPARPAAESNISRLLNKADQHHQASGSKISSLLNKVDQRVLAGSANSTSRSAPSLPNKPKQPPGPPPGFKDTLASSAARIQDSAARIRGALAANSSKPKPPPGPPPGFKASTPSAVAPTTPRQPLRPPPGLKTSSASSSIPAPKTPPRQPSRPLQVGKIAKASISSRAIGSRPIQQKGPPPMPKTASSPPGATPNTPVQSHGASGQGIKRVRPAERPPDGYSRLQVPGFKARRMDESSAHRAAKSRESDEEEWVDVEEDQLVEDAEFEQLRQQALRKGSASGSRVQPKEKLGANTPIIPWVRVANGNKEDEDEGPAGASAAGASEVGGKVQELIAKGIDLDADALGALFQAPAGVACAVLADLENKKVNFANASKFVTTAVTRRSAVLTSRPLAAAIATKFPGYRGRT